MTYAFRKVPPQGGTAREIAEVINNTVDGKMNVTGEVTLTNSATSTVVTDVRVGAESLIVFMPITAGAATELAAGGMYVSSQGKQTFTVTHANNSTTRTFRFAVFA